MRTNPNLPNRRTFLASGVAAGVAAATAPRNVSAAGGGSEATQSQLNDEFELHELSISELQERLKSGADTIVSLTEKFLERIERVDSDGPGLNSIIELNPDALDIAKRLERERKQGKRRGPMHGMPVLLKDNIGTRDKMETTAGSLALVGAKPPGDSFVAKQLRAAGALILGKTNLSEWANMRSSNSTSGWSGRGGLTRNPYALDRNACGSSSGSAAAVAASLCAAAIGTETDGSIVSPSSACGIVGIKPTLGMVGRSGIVPLAHSQDTAGPMGRTVKDATLLLDVIAGVDADDDITRACQTKKTASYAKCLKPDALTGTTLGVARNFFEFHHQVDAVMESALGALEGNGATLVDTKALAQVDSCGSAEYKVLLYELKADMASYLQWIGKRSPMKTLKDLIAFNEEHRDEEMPYFGQDLFEQAEEKGTLEEYEYQEALARCRRFSRTEGIDAVMDANELDAIVAPTIGPACLSDLVNGDRWLGGSSSPAAVAGYPSITVPAGYVHGLPVGLTFFGRPWSEPQLLAMAYAFEQATKIRQPPQFRPTL